MILPGATIGILGGGQLGRMMAVAAAQLGYRTIGYAPAGHHVAADLCADFIERDWDDGAALAAFAARCDVVTWEFENVPLAAVAAIPESLLCPHPRALETAQDRLKEKRFIEQFGGRPAPYAAVEGPDDLARAIALIGAPGILKTAREGYDGKGQWRIASASEAAGLRYPGKPCVYEGLVDFAAEFSVILVRGGDGEIRFWDSTENRHHDGMLATSTLPASSLIAAQLGEARQLAANAAEALGYVGVMTLEFFATTPDSPMRGPVFNEMAPRVHNSGHWTIEGAATSQFENHIRVICGLPLGSTGTRFARVEMRNIIGPEALSAHRILGDGTEAHLHLYGKEEAREGRKMGHVTRVSNALETQ